MGLAVAEGRMSSVCMQERGPAAAPGADLILIGSPHPLGRILSTREFRFLFYFLPWFLSCFQFPDLDSVNYNCHTLG